MNKLFLIAIMGVFFCSCNKQSPAGVVRHANMFAYVVDQDGNDLLAPDNPNRIIMKDVKIYCLDSNGERLPENSNFIRDPLHEPIKTQDGRYVCGLYLTARTIKDVYIDGPSYIGQELADTKTLIVWNEKRSDTVTVSFRQGVFVRSGSIFQEKIWIKDELVWDDSKQPGTTPDLAYTFVVE